MGSPLKIWVKFRTGRPVKITFDGGDVDDLIKAIKNQHSEKLKDVDTADIILRKHGEEVDLEPDDLVDQSFQNTAKTPLQVIVQEEDQAEEEEEEPGN